MAGKRKKAPAATAGGNPQRRKSTSSLKSEAATSDAGATDDTQAESALLFETEKFMVLNPWCSDVLSLFDALWEQHGEPVAILHDIIGGDSKEAKQEWAGFLANTFPPDRDILYMTTWDGFSPEDSSDLGLCFLRPFQLPFDVDAGNKGFVYREKVRNLVQLILAKGFRSNPTEPGVPRPTHSWHTHCQAQPLSSAGVTHVS